MTYKVVILWAQALQPEESVSVLGLRDNALPLATAVKQIDSLNVDELICLLTSQFL